jgi:hypothetical protein
LLFGLFSIFTTRVAAQPTGVEQNLNARVSALEEKVAVAEQLLVNQGQQISSLQQRVVSLESAVFRPRAFTVDCAGGQTIAGALAQAPAAGLVMITVVGQCTEAVTIDRHNTILLGASPGDGLQPPSPADDVLTVTRGAHVTLDQVTLTGGRLFVREGAHFTASNPDEHLN